MLDIFPPNLLPVMMAQLAAASWETILRRTLMMVQCTCTAAEYRRMAAEKVTAMHTSMSAATGWRGQTAVLAPFVNRTRANVLRLRRKL
jgi:7-cyano-7-deazaguanine synthase in queuosine biosynthesis